MQQPAFEEVALSAEAPPAYISTNDIAGNTSSGVLPSYQVIVVKEPEPDLKRYPTRTTTALGALQIVCGVSAIILGACAIGMENSLSFVGYGIWSGVLPIISGCFGIVSGAKKSKCTIVASMVTSIVAASIIYEATSLAISSAVQDGIEPSYRYGNYYSGYYGYSGYSGYNSQYDSMTRNSRLAIDILLIIVLALEAVLAIWSSGIACRFSGCCCGCCRQCCCSCYDNGEKDMANNGTVPIRLLNVQGQPLLIQGHSSTVPTQAAGGPTLQFQGLWQNQEPGLVSMEPPVYASNPNVACMGVGAHPECNDDREKLVNSKLCYPPGY